MFLELRTVVYQVHDLRKATEWYGKVLGSQPYFDQPLYAGCNVGGYELGLVPEPNAGSKRAPSGLAYGRGGYPRGVSAVARTRIDAE
jgi:catechol 2,3-dioxygenase-like lactoylglutathione lyase family enzyme